MTPSEHIPQCWCGSGESYATCHGRRATEEPIPPNALAKLALKLGRHSACMHFAASSSSCSAGIIDAHSVQRSRELKELVDSNNQVMMFDPTSRDPGGQCALVPVGWRTASTFPGFCSTHDSGTFAPVENRRFEATEEQCLILAYRSLCYELHRKRSVALANPKMRQLVDRGSSEWLQRQIQAHHQVANDGVQKGLQHFAEMKTTMDASLARGDVSAWSTVVLWFSGPLSVATCGVLSPNRDLDGAVLQCLHQPMNDQESLCCNIVATDGGGSAVLTWLTSSAAPFRFVSRLLRDRESALSLLMQVLFRHVHNLYFSDRWWQSLRPTQKVFLRGLASLTSQEAYYAPLDFRPRSRVVPWTLERVTSHRTELASWT